MNAKNHKRGRKYGGVWFSIVTTALLLSPFFSVQGQSDFDNAFWELAAKTDNFKRPIDLVAALTKNQPTKTQGANTTTTGKSKHTKDQTDTFSQEVCKACDKMGGGSSCSACNQQGGSSSGAGGCSSCGGGGGGGGGGGLLGGGGGGLLGGGGKLAGLLGGGKGAGLLAGAAGALLAGGGNKAEPTIAIFPTIAALATPASTPAPSVPPTVAPSAPTVGVSTPVSSLPAYQTPIPQSTNYPSGQWEKKSASSGITQF